MTKIKIMIVITNKKKKATRTKDDDDDDLLWQSILKLYNLYASPNIVRDIETNRMRWESHVARKERLQIHTTIWLENLQVRDHVEHKGVDERIILEWILENRLGRCGLD
jgi:hypothetical protein